MLKANSDSDSDLLVNHFLAPNKAYLVTLTRPPEAVQRAHEHAKQDLSHVTVIDGTENPVEAISRTVENLGDEESIVIDKVDELKSHAEYESTLRMLHESAIEHDTVHYLHGGRDKDLDFASSISDTVLELITRLDGDELSNRLVIRKNRSASIDENVVKVKLLNEVKVDTSREIG